MRLHILALICVPLLAATGASASPLLKAAADRSVSSDRLVTPAHHKPGHKGGPPWARRGSDRADWREEPRYPRPTTAVCHTEYRARFDPYAGVYVRRPVRICRERYGYAY